MIKRHFIPKAFITVFLLITCGCMSGFIYYPDKKNRGIPSDKGLSYEIVSLNTKDGKILSGWWLPAGTPKGVILFCHGNAGNISYRLDSLLIFNRLGLSTFIFDYRGYGDSIGRPSEQGTYIDAETAWNYLVHTRKIPSRDIIILGRSLGGSIAAWLAKEKQPGLLIIESSFTSLKDVVKDILPWFPTILIKNYQYDTRQYLADIHCPVLIIHSQDDEVIPFWHGKKLFDTVKGSKEFIEIEGPHNCGFLYSLSRYESAINSFIAGYTDKIPVNDQ